MNLNLKYFLIPLLAFSLTTAHASSADDGDSSDSSRSSHSRPSSPTPEDDEQKSDRESLIESLMKRMDEKRDDDAGSASSGAKVSCGDAVCQAKKDALRREGSGSGRADEPDDERSPILEILKLLTAVHDAAQQEDYSEILRENTPTRAVELCSDSPDVKIDSPKATLTKLVFQDVETEAKRRVLTLTNGARLSFYSSKMDALQFFVDGPDGQAMRSTYFANELVRFGNVTLSPADGFKNIAARLVRAQLMAPQDPAEESVTVTYVKCLKLEYECNLLEILFSGKTLAKASVAGSSNVNIIDPFFTPVVVAAEEVGEDLEG